MTDKQSQKAGEECRETCKECCGTGIAYRNGPHCPKCFGHGYVWNRRTTESVPGLASGELPDDSPWVDLLAYVLQGEMHNRLTPRVIDIAYTAFMCALQPNTEDGGPSDWFNDTKPSIEKAIEKLRQDLFADRTAKAAKALSQPISGAVEPNVYSTAEAISAAITEAGGCYSTEVIAEALNQRLAVKEGYQDSTSQLHVGDSSFEDWYQGHPKASGGDKQLARDAYAAGMGDPMVTATHPVSDEQQAKDAALYAVYHTEEYVGSFFQGVFSSEVFAQHWIDNKSPYPSNECFIRPVQLDAPLWAALSTKQEAANK